MSKNRRKTTKTVFTKIIIIKALAETHLSVKWLIVKQQVQIKRVKQLATMNIVWLFKYNVFFLQMQKNTQYKALQLFTLTRRLVSSWSSFIDGHSILSLFLFSHICDTVCCTGTMIYMFSNNRLRDYVIKSQLGLWLQVCPLHPLSRCSGLFPMLSKMALRWIMSLCLVSWRGPCNALVSCQGCCLPLASWLLWRNSAWRFYVSPWRLGLAPRGF